MIAMTGDAPERFVDYHAGQQEHHPDRNCNHDDQRHVENDTGRAVRFVHEEYDIGR